VTGTPQDLRHKSFFLNNYNSGVRRARTRPMRFLTPILLPGLLLYPLAHTCASQEFLRQAAETNVNQQYTVESVSVAGVQIDDETPSRLPKSLRIKLRELVGSQCDSAVLEELSAQIRREMHFRSVTEHLTRGSAPGRVKVNFEVERRELAFDLSLPRFLYHSKQGPTGEVDANTRVGQGNLTFGVVSNGDDLVERFSGFRSRYDSGALGSDRVHLGVTFENYHEKWNSETREAVTAGSPDLYRSRWNVAPELTLTVARPLTVSVGASFQGMASEASGGPDQSANAATLDVHYGRKIEGERIQQQVEGKYSLRLATHALGSTYSYARHLISMRYEAKAGRHTVTNEVVAGSVAGNAPYFERFVLGSSSTLRGWDRYEIDPLGGSRVVHNELTYGYRFNQGTVEGFYDTGALWESDRPATVRHSVGVGYKKGIFVLSMAFPIRNGHIEPVFMAGMNY
jgi:hypothetical protein